MLSTKHPFHPRPSFPTFFQPFPYLQSFERETIAFRTLFKMDNEKRPSGSSERTQKSQTIASTTIIGDAGSNEHSTNPNHAHTDLKRGLTARHVMMISIGGAIGVDL
jgi:amino acid permease